MIRIKKGRAPAFFNSKELLAARAAFEQNQNVDISTRRQSRAPVRFPYLPELRQELLKESHGKCVYCEQKLTAAMPMEVDHYRPARGAIDAHGGRSEDHYYWLAYDWENLYACCVECNRAKGSKFPVASDRAPLLVGGDLDAVEQPLILNPARDDLEKHLEFRYDGQVAPKTTQGQYTIDVLRLNRTSLIQARAAHVKELKATGNPLHYCREEAEFCGLSRQVVQNFPTAFEGAAKASPVPTELADLLRETMTPDEEEQLKYYSSFPLISSIEIQGLCGLSSVTVRIPPSQTGRTACLALLGENGVGKSSILKCLALALYDRRAHRQLAVDVAGLLNEGEREGWVRVTFDTQMCNQVRVTRNGIEFGNSDPVPMLLLAYGPTRLLPTPLHKHAPESEMSQAKNLFDPFVPLRDPGRWLNSLDDSQFDYAAAAIKALLQLRDDCRLHRTDDANSPISLEMFGSRHPLERLSHGYRSVLAMVCDVMATLFSRWQSIDAAQGVVLVDELENHLHPAWKLRLVDSLRRAFPRIQFIVTTHDPLCLRGFEAGEVVLLRRQTDSSGSTAVLQELPAVSDMRIDQILTSSYFGLRSTVDPAVELLFDEYYTLLEREWELDDDEREKLELLRVDVAKFDIPALLPRDRVVYAVIDRYLSRHDRSVPDNKEDFDGDLQALVDEIIDGLPGTEGDLQ